MGTTAIIAFREFLEAFLIVGVFLGISRKLKLGREVEIGFAAGVGFFTSLMLASLLYIFGDFTRAFFTQDSTEILEGYLMIFSGFFITYVIFSLHDVMRKSRGGELLVAHKKLQDNAFDISLFFTITMLVLREGFEVSLFTASVSLFSAFMQNFLGLIIGFSIAAIVGCLTYISYIKFPIGKIFKATHYLVMLLGAALIQTGITEILEHNFNIHLSDYLTFHFQFLPTESSFLGHLIRGLLGIDQEFSGARLAIMLVYFFVLYFIFFRKSKAVKSAI